MKFNSDLTIKQAMELHPKAREVFAGFHLGGCSHCGISEFETIAQVCEGYGVPVEMLIDTLNTLFETEVKPEEKPIDEFALKLQMENLNKETNLGNG